MIPEQMPGQRSGVLDWPYVEGLRLDEAMHPLTLLAFGLYGEVLPQPERRAAAAGRAVEIWLQEREIHRQDPLRREAADDHLDARRTRRVRLLFQRQSRRWTIRAGARPGNAASASSSSAPR